MLLPLIPFNCRKLYYHLYFHSSLFATINSDRREYMIEKFVIIIVIRLLSWCSLRQHIPPHRPTQKQEHAALANSPLLIYMFLKQYVILITCNFLVHKIVIRNLIRLSSWILFILISLFWNLEHITTTNILRMSLLLCLISLFWNLEHITMK